MYSKLVTIPQVGYTKGEKCYNRKDDIVGTGCSKIHTVGSDE